MATDAMFQVFCGYELVATTPGPFEAAAAMIERKADLIVLNGRNVYATNLPQSIDDVFGVHEAILQSMDAAETAPNGQADLIPVKAYDTLWSAAAEAQRNAGVAAMLLRLCVNELCALLDEKMPVGARRERILAMLSRTTALTFGVHKHVNRLCALSESYETVVNAEP